MVPPTAPMLRLPTLALAAWLAGAAQVASALRAEALGVAPPQWPWDSGTEPIKKPLVHKAPRSGSEGKGPVVPQEVPLHSLLRRPGVASPPETKSATPLDLTFMFGWEEVGCYWRG